MGMVALVMNAMKRGYLPWLFANSEYFVDELGPKRCEFQTFPVRTRTRRESPEGQDMTRYRCH